MKRFPVIAAGLIMALFAHVAHAQSTITILKYDDKGNVVGVIKKTINQKINRKRAPQTRSRASGSSAEISGTAPIDAGAEPREVLISNPPATLLPQLQADGYQLLERIILNNIDAQFLRLRAPQGITADGAIDEIRQRFPGILIDKNSFFNLSAGKQRDRAGVYANDVTKWGHTPSRCGRGLSIGMIDTAFSPNHPALRGRDIIHRSFVKKKRKPGKSTHGATVAALLVGNPRNGLPGGLLPGATLFAGSIYEDRGDGKLRGNLSSMIKALDWMVEERVSVVNLAMAGSKNKVLAYIIRKASAKGLVLIAAAGNGGPRAKPAFPAANPRVIAVTAIDRQLGVYRYANRGEYIDFAAPGVGLQVATAKPGKLQSGTSFATPFITSIVALHLAQGGRARPDPIRTALRKLVKDLGAPGRDDTFGWGLVQYRPKC